MREFPGGAVVGTPHFQSMRHRFDPWAGTKILHAMQLGQKNKKKKKKRLRIHTQLVGALRKVPVK